jgi:predicted HicB family RNase H-like nuclease
LALFFINFLEATMVHNDFMLTLRIPTDLAQRLADRATADGLSVSALCREALETALREADRQ